MKLATAVGAICFERLIKLSSEWHYFSLSFLPTPGMAEYFTNFIKSNLGEEAERH
jgi:hypothetical protein